MRPIAACLLLLFAAAVRPAASADPTRADRGMPQVAVRQAGTSWVIAGQRQTVTLDAKTLAIHIQAGPRARDLAASTAGEFIVRRDGHDLALRLADAGEVAIESYDTGERTGLKLTLTGWSAPMAVATRLHLTVALQGADEDLVFEVAAEENGAAIRQLDWPTAMDAEAVDYTVVPNSQGNLIPRHWPKAYHPIRHTADLGATTAADTSFVQSNVIECWSMAWWGFEKQGQAAMLIVETPDDAAYQFSHPAGGPTVIGPRWRPSLGHFGYERTVRLCFLPGDYVAMAKRYRRYVMDRGQFVSLKEKIARSPRVAALIGTPLTRLGILKNLNPAGVDFHATAPEKRYSLHTFDARIAELKALKASGIDRLHICLTGWPNLGYDRQHPDELPPNEAGGGWAGLRRFTEACRSLGYVVTFHDQYRDYYVDTPSYQSQFAIHEEDAASAPVEFPGTRFGGGLKEGVIPFMDHWEGGKQTYLTARLMIGHLAKNYTTLTAHGISPDGVYLDVFGYVPPDEDFNPEHPVTRTDAMRARADCYNWVRARLGVVGTEAGCDWTEPYVDICSPVAPGKCVDVPLYNLVYHDAIITPYKSAERHDILRGLLNGGLPQLFDLQGDSAKNLLLIRIEAALHERLATVEMTGHEFIGEGYRKERSHFADGTSVTVDWDQASYEISPALPLPAPRQSP